MFIGGIIAASVLMAAMVVIGVFLYSYGVYVKNRLFTKPKLSIIILVIVGLIIAGLLFIGIYLAVKAGSVKQKSQDYATESALILVDAILMIINYACYIVVTLVSKNNKIDYTSIPNVDWEAKISELKLKVDVEQLKSFGATSEKSYYQDMLNSYKEILNKAKDPEYSDAEKMADIVMFNENFTHKWSTKNNNLQLLLTYEFCKIFKK